MIRQEETAGGWQPLSTQIVHFGGDCRETVVHRGSSLKKYPSSNIHTLTQRGANHTLHLPLCVGRLGRPCGAGGGGLSGWVVILPSSSSLTSLAAVRPSSLRFFSMALLRSRAALSSALKVHPMVREHSLIALRRPGSTAETEKRAAKRQKKKKNQRENKQLALLETYAWKQTTQRLFFSLFSVCVCVTW